MGAKKEDIFDEMEEEEDEDNVPIAFSRGRKPGLRNGNASSNVKKEEGKEELDGKPPKRVKSILHAHFSFLFFYFFIKAPCYSKL